MTETDQEHSGHLNAFFRRAEPVLVVERELAHLAFRPPQPSARPAGRRCVRLRELAPSRPAWQYPPS